MRVTAEAARRFLVARHALAPARSLLGGPDAVTLRRWPDERWRWAGRFGTVSTVSEWRAAEAWIRGHVESVLGTELVHARPWATVRRVQFSGGAAWFKACAPVQRFEPRLTAALAGRWPDRLPELLAWDDERAWLLLGDAGRPLGFEGQRQQWLSILPSYAELQRGEAAHVDEHLDGGVPDRRLATFPALYEAMLARNLPLAATEVSRLRTFAPRFSALCEELMAQGLPETVQHDDLHGANVYPRPQEEQSALAPDLRPILSRCVAMTAEKPRLLH